ncbi:MAG: N-acetylmuramoyl-L-alanine amidase [Syntrophomonadaceae bacterium]|nr:N-acetylmuramoyl-L-alanine amidase [Syntrophomonadaceae bacterium]
MLKNRAVFINNWWIRSLSAAALFILAVYSATAGPEEQTVFSYALAGTVIVIDPGHGGVDSGAARGGILEKDITLQISKKLARQLSQSGALVVLLRENESDLAGDEFTGRIKDHKNEDMLKRVNKANEAKGDLFISIHVNASPSSVWSGAQTFYKPEHEESRKIAEAIQNALRFQLKNTKRAAAAGDFFVLKKTNMPAVMVEAGFLSNKTEADLLTDNDYQERLVHAIITGLANFRAARPDSRSNG